RRGRFRVMRADRFRDGAGFNLGFERKVITPAFSGQVAADVDGYAVKPAIKIMRRVESAEGFVDSHEGLLRRVTRVFLIAQHSPRQRDDLALVADDNLIERRPVAGFRADY